MIWRNQAVIAKDHHGEAVTLFDFGQRVTFAVQDIKRDFACNMNGKRAGTTTHAFFFKHTQKVKGGTFDRTDKADTAAMCANLERAFNKRRAQALARHFKQAEWADTADLKAGPVIAHGFFKLAFNRPLVAVVFHVDEIDHNQTGQIAQAQLTCEFFGGFKVGLVCGFFDVAFTGRTARVHVNRDQCLGRVDDDIATRFKLHDRIEHRIKLAFHLEAVEQRNTLIFVRLHALCMRRHQHLHEVFGDPVTFVTFDQNFVNIACIKVTDGPFDQISFFINQARCLALKGGFANTIPQTHQIIEVAFNFGLGAFRTCGTHDNGHAIRNFQFGQNGFQALAILCIGDLARNAATARGIWHQNAITTRQRQEGRKRSTLVTAFFLDHLHKQDLAALDHFLNLVALLHLRAMAVGEFIPVIAAQIINVFFFGGTGRLCFDIDGQFGNFC